MTPAIRIVAIGSIGLMAWGAAASRVADHSRLAPSAVVVGAVLTQPFGCSTLVLEPFDPLCPTHHVHTGIDLAAPTGTAVHAATAGVAHVGYDPNGAGIYVAVRVDAHVRILYCHLSSTSMTAGEEVLTGQVIGHVGATGLATGPHLHLEIQVDGRSVDPAIWLVSEPS